MHKKIAILHTSAPPVVGGVETTIQAHAWQLHHAGFPLVVITGTGDPAEFPQSAEFFRIDELDPQHPEIQKAHQLLNQGHVPADFTVLVERIANALERILADCDHVMVHNAFTQAVNLPLTAALHSLIARGKICHVIAWCHDLAWSRADQHSSLFHAYPWNLLKTYRREVTYVAISLQRQREFCEVFETTLENVKVIYEGVDPVVLYGLSAEGAALLERLQVFDSDLILLMPVRITPDKNIEYAIEVVAWLKSLEIRPKLILTGPPDQHDAKWMAYYQELLRLRAQMRVENEIRFVYESGITAEPYRIPRSVVAELFRVCDIMFMPSHQEGFGLPVLEAGLAGIPVVSTPVPAAVEIGFEDMFVFSLSTDPAILAEQILNWAEENPEYRLRCRVRQNYTWPVIFRRDILPLLQ